MTLFSASTRQHLLAAAAAQSRAPCRRYLATESSSITEAALTRFAQSTVFPDYPRLAARLSLAHAATNNRPLTLTDKILFSHLADPHAARAVARGQSSLMLHPDRVSMQDASAQTAVLQFMLANLPQSKVPVSIVCDHLVVGDTSAPADQRDGSGARSVAGANLKQSWADNLDVYEFLSSASRRFGFDYWAPGNGIIHQLVLENYAAPGLLMLGTDSHTPNAGGLGAMAIGVGGADALDAMCGVPWELTAPKVTGVRLTGKLPEHGWTAPKDVALWLLGKLGVRGGTGHVLEYFGDGVDSLSATACATIANMGAEMGATTTVFPVTSSTLAYLSATYRSHLISPIQSHLPTLLSADREVHANPGSHYDRVIELDLSTLEPHVNGPMTPDRAIPLSQLANTARSESWPLTVSASLIGSCTNSSYEDLATASSILTHARTTGVSTQVNQLVVSPGSDQVRATVARDGILAELANSGATVLANACGPCIGQWKRTDHDEVVKPKTKNVIVSSFNRNFAGRNDGNPNTLHFLASPQVVAAFAVAGRLDFNPITDTLPVGTGAGRMQLQPPTSVPTLPPKGFAVPDVHAIRGQPDARVDVVIPPTSTRLAPLPRWPAWPGTELGGEVLLRVRGKCTTDDISAAGPWLKYKGHLPAISRNTLMTAVNDETGVRGKVTSGASIPDAAHKLAGEGRPWVVVGDYNYGEGSAREHAAMQVRYLGCPVVIARSFARIHETNLKKQGVVPLTLVNAEEDHVKFCAGMRVETVGLVDVMQEAAALEGEADQGDVVSPLGIRLRVVDGNTGKEVAVVQARHSLSRNQWAWIRAGGALNALTAA
ncbi:hypothetical protein BCR44DRAFT_1538584 [Catenaria anguillulae PL171]|uniref:Aconitate hydratase, mitochondrial n=1 Tax=Catenaria anguillulae PL171 TaxID=765915 RepID=A0A1Y2I0F8_9FUNG|nr:hypothetical protein BCR44DRAFT_1538584 [Catenaria anguillulae PL171]